jgi:hypothetical protein
MEVPVPTIEDNIILVYETKKNGVTYTFKKKQIAQ